VIWGLFFTLVGTIFSVAGPWFIRLAINGLQTSISHEKLWLYGGMVLAVAGVSGVSRFFTRRLIIGVSRNIEYDMRQRLMRHLLTLEPAFYDRSRIGDLMTRSTSDIEQVRMVIGPALMYMTTTVLTLIFGIALMLLISVKLTIIVFIIGPLISIVVFLMGRYLHRASSESQAAFSDLSAMVQENLAGIRVVKAFRQGAKQEERFAERSETLLRKNLRMILLNGMFHPSIMMVFGLAIALILLVGGKLIIDGKLLLGDFVAFLSYLMILTWPMISTGWVVSLFQRGRASLERIHQLLDRKPEIVDPDSPVTDPAAVGEVVFDSVSFQYPLAEMPSLINVGFSIKAGHTLGIVGRVGSGKSTVAHLLTRLYDAEQGQISVEGVDVHQWSTEALRNRIVVVPQDPLLFSISIRENIILGGDYSDEDVARAVEISRLSQDIEEFPEGLDTEIGERGITLSGGQKQRVAIARAVIRNPQIMIFDDALSAVDADTEEKILENFHSFLENRTAIIISHRVTSVAEANEILVLDEGKVIERGKHSTLLKKGGIYSDLFKQQKMARELEDVA